MAISHEDREANLLTAAIEKSRNKLGSPITSAERIRDDIIVRSAIKTVTYRIERWEQVDEHGTPYLGGDRYKLIEASDERDAVLLAAPVGRDPDRQLFVKIKIALGLVLSAAILIYGLTHGVHSR